MFINKKMKYRVSKTGRSGGESENIANAMF
jgi:hypothetical protein